jgi:hypothetical protein
MARSFITICEALSRIRSVSPWIFESLKVRLVGTQSHWREGDPRLLHEIAARHGLGDVVDEHPPRISYRHAMDLLEGSDGVIVLGVDEPGYVPSKLFTYALSGKPLLASLRSESPAVGFFDEVPNLGHLLRFGPEENESEDGAAVAMAFLSEVQSRKRVERRLPTAGFLARAMARRHAELFDRICSPNAAA